MVQFEYDCCSDRFKATAEVRDLRNEVHASWTLVELDESGSPAIERATSDTRVRQLNGRLRSGGYVSLPQLRDAESIDLDVSSISVRGLTVDRANGRLVVRRGDGSTVGTLPLPNLSLSGYCCDGGIDEKVTCEHPPHILGIWGNESVMVFAIGLIHQADGCSEPPVLHVVPLERRGRPYSGS